MELDKIEILLEKYFQAETSIDEENLLKNYFSGNNVAPHLKNYAPLFGYLIQEKKQEFLQKIKWNGRNKKVVWLSVAASFMVVLGLITFYSITNSIKPESNELGTYNDPEHAFKETQKALAMLSNKVNIGLNSVEYFQEYDTTKNKVFKK